MLDIASINTAPNAATLTVGSPVPDSDSFAASIGAMPASAGDGPDLWHRLWGKDGFSFSTLLDIVNPLQHIPVVSTVYQKLTGDEASTGANVVGGALFGGVIGFAVSALDSAIKGETGKDMGGHVFAMFESGKPGASPASDIAVAQADDSRAEAPPSDPSLPPDAPAANDAGTESTDAAAIAAGASVAPQPATLAAAAATPAGADRSAAGDSGPAKPAAVAAKNAPAGEASDAPKSAFVLANSRPRSYSGKGVGNGFVPLESRSTILPAAYFAPPPPGAPADDKPARGKPASALPDPKILAANPDLLRKFQATRTANPAALPANATPGGAGVLPDAPLAGADGAPSQSAADPKGFAALMARNLEHYMALQNKGAAPRIDQKF